MARCGYSYYLEPGKYETVPSFRPTKAQAAPGWQRITHDDYIWLLPCSHFAAEVDMAWVTPICIHHMTLRQRSLAIAE